jgi:membrane associated rhomboid family serine protease
VIPLGDDTRGTGFPVVIVTLMVACVAVFAWQLSWSGPERALITGLGFVPGALFGGAGAAPGVPALPPPATLVSYQFFHSSWLHLLGNLAYFWVFGRSVERGLGAGRTCALFIATGVLAALAHASADPASATPIVGASGGLSGLLGAYLVRFPRAEVEVLVPLLVVMQVVRLPAWLLLAAWFLLQLLLDWLTPAEVAGVAFRAHVGGFVAGAVLVAAGPPLARLTGRALATMRAGGRAPG